MKAEEFVGKWIVSEVLTDELNVPAGTVFKVVGFVLDKNLVIVDAERRGWKGLEPDDVVIERCETYKYARLDEITVVSQQFKNNAIMKAKELVGKWIVSKVLADELNAPASTGFKVVGYVPNMNLVIVDAERRGWKGLIPGDVVVEECETYKYVTVDYITEVL